MAKLVVDASVARSCGDRTATQSPAPECRDFLLAMQEHKHKVVMTKDIRAEWDKHQSRFATQWLSQMVGKKLLHAITISEIDQEIWQPIEEMAKTDQQRAAMIKDILLLEAALATDQRIVSLDEKVRKYFTEVAQEIKQFRQLVWVNPGKLEEEAIDWLGDGAPAEEKRMLGFLGSGLE